jgi:hypothetical protein
MKIEQLIIQYLYTNKQVTLQDIGTFTVSKDINIPLDSEKDTVLPENAIEFGYNPRAGVDDGLIGYIMEHTRKIKPLATSDLESFIMLNKQFLNIGKPLIMDGLGTLHKTQDGKFAFTQTGTSHVMTQEVPKEVTEKFKEKVSFATPQKEKSSGSGKWILATIIGILLAGGALAAYYFLVKNKTKSNDTEIVKSDDNSKENTNTSDTTNKNKKDTGVTKTAIMPVLAKDSSTFYVVIKEFTDYATAKMRCAKLVSYGNNFILTTKDSVTYKMKMPFRNALADTTRVKDSIGVYFQAKNFAYIELP